MPAVVKFSPSCFIMYRVKTEVNVQEHCDTSNYKHFVVIGAVTQSRNCFLEKYNLCSV